MKTMINTIGTKKTAARLLTFALIMAVLVMAFVPFTNSTVYGDQTSTDGAVATPKWKVTFLDIDGSVLKVQEVEDGQDAQAPNIKAKKGYKFLGWSDWYIDVTSDRTVRAVYELVMTTTDEDDGELAAAGTANPPAEKIAIATEGGLEVIDTSEEAITTPEVIKNNPTPTTVIPGDEDTGLSTTTIVLIIVAALVVLAVAGYIIFMFVRKRRKEDYSS